jgi:hypothetical protein
MSEADPVCYDSLASLVMPTRSTLPDVDLADLGNPTRVRDEERGLSIASAPQGLIQWDDLDLHVERRTLNLEFKVTDIRPARLDLDESD